MYQKLVDKVLLSLKKKILSFTNELGKEKLFNIQNAYKFEKKTISRKGNISVENRDYRPRLIKNMFVDPKKQVPIKSLTKPFFFLFSFKFGNGYSS